MNIAFLHEHPTWSDALLSEFESRGINLLRINVAELSFNANVESCPFRVAINRVNIMPSANRAPQVVFQTQHYLNWLELCGVRIINGARAHAIGASKAMQNGVFSVLGLAHPSAIAIYRAEDALAAAEQIGYPVIIKPNIGGSGSGVSLFNTALELDEAIRFKALDLGVDRSGLVQKYIESDGFIYRVEVLGDELFYSIRQPIQQGNFNYCAADGCSAVSEEQQPNERESDFDFCVLDNDNRISVFEPDIKIVTNVVNIVKNCGADLGGVEYFIDVKTGKPCYYDFNPYSNFVTDGDTLLGFSPEQRYIDFIIDTIQDLDIKSEFGL